MKKIKIYSSLLLACGFLITGCEARLDEFEPYNQQTLDSFYKTPAEFSQAVNGMYSGMRTGGYYGAGGTGSDYNIVADVLSDNVILNIEGRQSGRQNAEFTYNSNNTATALYTAAYFVAARSNAILKNIDNLPVGTFKDNVKGQALAIRGLTHFDVVRSYSKIPTQSSDANASIGIAYLESFDPEAKPSRLATVSETYTKIIADLETASTLIGVVNESGKLDRKAVKGLLSRVYLFQGNYALAAQRAQECITLGATLATRVEFPGIWRDAPGDRDILFKTIINTQDNIQLGTNYFQLLNGEIFSEYVCDFSLFNLFTATDVRKAAYIKTSLTGTKTYNHIIKYDTNTANLRFINGKYLRVAEIHLNLAEALLKRATPDEAGALAALNALRSRRYLPYTPGTETGAALLNAVYLERRLELAFESDRFYTIKRLGQSLQRSGFGHLSDGTGTAAFPQQVPASDHRWQLPLSRNTLLYNSNIIQNPNY